jgi:hypothetical protein
MACLLIVVSTFTSLLLVTLGVKNIKKDVKTCMNVRTMFQEFSTLSFTPLLYCFFLQKENLLQAFKDIRKRNLQVPSQKTFLVKT